MKLFKYLLSALIVTFALLTYTHQQIELLKISYEIRDAEKLVAVFLDQNRNLRYNIASLESPENLAKFASAKKPNLITPVGLQQIVRLREFNPAEFGQLTTNESFFNFFIPTAEASINQVKQ